MIQEKQTLRLKPSFYCKQCGKYFMKVKGIHIYVSEEFTILRKVYKELCNNCITENRFDSFDNTKDRVGRQW